MQHIKSYMAKIDRMINDDSPKKSKKTADTTGVDDKNVRIIASFVKGIREARKGMLNAN